METRQTVFKNTVDNDEIDIYKNPDVAVNILKTDNRNKFSAQFEGKNIDESVVNAIRRCILLYIPIYGFYRTNIHVDNDRTKSMYNNDMIFNIVETLPLFEIPNLFDLENPELFLPDDVMRSMFGRYIQTKYIDVEEMERRDNEPIRTDPNKKQYDIEISLAIKNTDREYLFVTTHHLVMRIDGKVVENYNKHPPLTMFILRQKEEMYFSAKANIGIAKIHAAYEATTTAYHKQLSPTKYILNYKSLGQLDPNIIFNKSCIILIKKLQILSEYITDKYKDFDSKDDFTTIELIGAEHTIGNLLATILQKCVHVREAGYVMKHPLEGVITIKYRLQENSKKGSIIVLLDCIKYLIKLFTTILDKFTEKIVEISS